MTKVESLLLMDNLDHFLNGLWAFIIEKEHLHKLLMIPQMMNDNGELSFMKVLSFLLFSQIVRDVENVISDLERDSNISHRADQSFSVLLVNL